jgi:hypothetical protein
MSSNRRSSQSLCTAVLQGQQRVLCNARCCAEVQRRLLNQSLGACVKAEAEAENLESRVAVCMAPDG